jgi:hypothetical protein
MRMKVVGMDEVYEGVIKVTLGNKGHKGFSNKLFLYVSADEAEADLWWSYHYEVDVIVGPVAGEPEPELAPMEHAGESSAEEGERD